MTSAHLAVTAPTAANKEGIATLSLTSAGQALSRLDIEFSQLAGLRTSSAAALDFLVFAATVYGLDKMTSRSTAPDAWTRSFDVTTPVSSPQLWNDAKEPLLSALAFLSGDRWSCDFVAHASPVLRPQPRSRRRQVQSTNPPWADVACLFSGGLDSLVGAIDLLESGAGTVMLVGHHDGQMKGPLADQTALLSGLKKRYPRRIHPVLVRVGHEHKAHDITLRCRSILFLALGIYGASAVGPSAPLIVPENGTIALNVPLTPSRRGSCSTRTTHPAFFGAVEAFLPAIGLAHGIINPLASKTKGEVVAECANPELLRSLVTHSVSCAKRGHKSTWVRKSAKGCGRCMPCIYRRAALHKVGWDDEQYGTDICNGEVDVDGHGRAANDLRACLGFLKRNPSSAEIESILLCNGSIDVTALPAAAAMVQRAMDEIRALLADKALTRIRRLAGL